jgi:hypothetical protein
MERKREDVTTGTPVIRAAGTLLVALDVRYSVGRRRRKGRERIS